MRKILIIVFLLLFVSVAHATQWRHGHYGFGTETRHLYESTGDKYLFIVDDLTMDADALDTSCTSSANGSAVGDGFDYVMCGGFKDVADYIYNSVPANSGWLVLFDISGASGNKGGAHKTSWFSRSNGRVAGESAPGKGFLYYNGTVTIHADDVIMSHIRVKGGTDSVNCASCTFIADTYYRLDSGYVTENIVIDHCSFGWALDETILLWANPDTDASGETIQNVTVSNTLIENPVNCTGSSTSEDPHGLLVFRSESDTDNHAKWITVRDNLFVTVDARCPWIQGTESVVENNICYNFHEAQMRIMHDRSTELTYRYNFVEGGSFTTTGHEDYFLQIRDWGAAGDPIPDTSEIYTIGNEADGYAQQASASDWGEVYDEDNQVADIRITTEPSYVYDNPALELLTATLETDLDDEVGAFAHDRSEGDDHAVDDYVSDTGSSNAPTALVYCSDVGDVRCIADNMPSTTHDLDDASSLPTNVGAYPPDEHTYLGVYTKLEHWLARFDEHARTGSVKFIVRGAVAGN